MASSPDATTNVERFTQIWTSEVYGLAVTEKMAERIGATILSLAFHPGVPPAHEDAVAGARKAILSCTH